MNDLPRQKLCEIVRQHGRSACTSARRCKNLLRKACPGSRREIYVLLAALELGVVADLLALPDEPPWPAAAAPLVRRLRDEMSMTEEAARWGVDSWAVALGKIDSGQAVPSLGRVEDRELGGTIVAWAGLPAVLTGAFAGAFYGVLLWAVGQAVCWGLEAAWQGTLVGAATGLLYGFRDRLALSPLGLLGWATGGAMAALTFDFMNGSTIVPLTGAMGWVFSTAIGRAVYRSVSRQVRHETPLLACAAGLLGVAVGWVLAVTLSGAFAVSLPLPWTWIWAGAAAGAISGALDTAHEGWLPTLLETGRRALAGCGLATAAVLLGGDTAGLLGWVVGGSLLFAVISGLFLGVERHLDTVWGVVFSPDGQFVLSASGDGTVSLWDVNQASLRGQFQGHTDAVYAVAFSPDGERSLSAGGDHVLRLVEGHDGEEVACLTGHTDEVYSVAFAPSGDRAVSGGADATVRLWNLTTETECRCLTGHDGPVLSVAYAPDGRHVVSGGANGTVRLREADSGEETAQLVGRKGAVHTVAFSPDGRLVLAGDDEGLRLWDVETGQQTGRFLGHEGAVYAATFSPDGGRVLSGGADGTVRLWDTASFAELGRFTQHRRAVRCVAFSPDGYRAVSGSEDQTLRLLNLPG